MPAVPGDDTVPALGTRPRTSFRHLGRHYGGRTARPAARTGAALIAAGGIPCTLIMLGAAMGSQNAAMRRIDVPGLPTANVVTTTLTGLLADIAAVRAAPRLGRRMAALAAITGGAALGAVLVLHASPATALGAATGPLALVTAMAHRFSPGAPDWSRPPQS